MGRLRSAVGTSLVVLVCGLSGSPVFAQQLNSAISGIARDTSGGVLPGVTVEAASPALIEKVRSVVTDSEGRYNIVDLRAGTYTVTFTLPGFNVFRREGIALTAGFAATVNADMQLGSLEETITVTGEAPLVDTRNARKQTSIPDELLDVLPSGTKSVNTLMTLTPGFSGIASPSDIYTLGPTNNATFHGKGGGNITLDGMRVDWAGGGIAYQPNAAVVSETVLQTSGVSADTNADGPVINMVPKEGSNSHSGSFDTLYSNDSLQSNNLTDKLRAQGLTGTGKVLKVYNLNLTQGGAIKRDRLWFFGSVGTFGNANQNPDTFVNLTQGTPFYTPDLTRPADRYQWYESQALRLTLQATQRQKVSLFVEHQRSCNCRYKPALSTRLESPEAAHAYHMYPTLWQGAWSAPLTNRLLVDAGAGFALANWEHFRNSGVTENDIAIQELSTGLLYNARFPYSYPQKVPRYAQRFAVSYVTGSHSSKVGFQMDETSSDVTSYVNRSVSYQFRNQVPTGLVQYATPLHTLAKVKADLGLYAQDQWRIQRFTLNYGVRFDYFNAYVPSQHLDATPNGWVPARDFSAVKNVPNWKDVDPRVGLAYDVFGNGRTALKVAIGRYVARETTGTVLNNNPAQLGVSSYSTSIAISRNVANRSWNDANGNYIPDCDLGNRAANGECGAMSDQQFGGTQIASKYTDDVLHGFGVRGFNWDMFTEVQHQLSARVSMSAGYYRNSYGNFTANDNLAVTPANYSPYCITAPKDQRLPGGGGYQVCGLYDINPDKFGQVDIRVTQASHFGKQRRVNQFMNFTMNGRFGAGARLGGGVDLGQTVNDTCFTIDSPQQLLNCHIVTPFKAQTSVKFFGSYPLPGDVVVSSIFQNMPGPEYQANYAASLAEIAPSLGRNLSGAARTATVPLVAPQTLFEPRVTRIDLRLTKMLNLSSRVRLQANVDLYNLLNASNVMLSSSVYGSQWRIPNVILDARQIQFSTKLTF